MNKSQSSSQELKAKVDKDGVLIVPTQKNKYSGHISNLIVIICGNSYLKHNIQVHKVLCKAEMYQIQQEELICLLKNRLIFR